MDGYRSCWLCGRNGAVDPLDEHHVFEGWSNRANSVKYDITVSLCHNRCHIFGRYAAHNCKETNDMIKRYGQRMLMLREGWNVDEFRMVFGKNWLDDDELDEIEEIQEAGDEAMMYEADGFRETDEVLCCYA